MAHPPTVTPHAPSWLGPVQTPQAKAAAQPAAQPADLNTSWRGLMSAIGVGLPYQLNRAARRSRNLHRAIR